jgi:hypothetical protein
MIWRDRPLPFGIDYIDPWVHAWPEASVRYSKAWASFELGKRLEPWAVRNASLITAVAPGYFEGVLARNASLRNVVTAAMPYGYSSADFAAPAVAATVPTQFDPADGRLHLVYAGALLPKAAPVLERVLEGIAALRTRDPEIASRMKLHFIGTGKSPNDPAGFNVLPVARRLGVADAISEHPQRMNYLDVLAHLTKCHTVVIIGSTEAHYTPSKVYQAIQSRRPVLAFLHESSTAVDVLRTSGAGNAVTFNERRLPSAPDVAAALKSIAIRDFNSDAVDWRQFSTYSARESARKMAAAMDEAVQRWAARSVSRDRGSLA